jgi:vWA-MoxR associated protein C-terminal domain
MLHPPSEVWRTTARQPPPWTNSRKSARLHLVVQVEPDGVDPERVLVTCWRQDDPSLWPPVRGDTRGVAIRDLETAVDLLVQGAERAWAAHSGEVALEFVLPRALLHLPVHQWHKERDSGLGRPLALDYLISVRSLDRMPEGGA